MQIDLEHFRENFFQQAGEQVGRMEAGLLALAAGDVNRGLLNAVFRGAQCIKGAAGTFGLVDIAELTHAMASLLDGMRSGEVEPEKNRIDLLLEGVDVLEALLASARHGSPAPSSSIGLRQRLAAAQGMDAFRASAAVPGKPAGPVWRIRFQPSPKVFLQGMDPLLVLRELGRLGTILDNHLDLAGMADLSALDPERCGLAWNLRLETTASESEVREVFAFVEDGARIELEREGRPRTPVVLKQTGGARALAGRDSGTIGMATGKLDRLIDLVGELVIAQSMAARTLHGFAMARLPELMDAFGEMERHTRQLQEGIMDVRMLPVGGVFHRMRRLVHDLAVATGKSIRLKISGSTTRTPPTRLAQHTGASTRDEEAVELCSR
jgi:two-component system chemotaxis sensor kinase CheA